MSQLAFKHQREKVAADRAGPWQAIFRPENNFCAETENFPVNWGTNHSRHSFVFGNKGSGYDDVKTGLCSTFGNPLARSVDLASPHERACSAINARASRARRLRCLRNKAPSLDSLFRLRSFSAYWRSAARTRAVGFLCLDEVSASSSRSFEVASSMAIFFIQRIIAAVSDSAQGLIFVPGTRGSEKETLMHKKVICLGLCAVFLAVGFAAHAQQQAKIYKIGWLGSRPAVREVVAERGSELLRRELRAFGYVEGKNIAFEYRSAEGEPNRLAALADELVRLKVDVLVISTPEAVLAAKKATTTIPIIFLLAGDPVAAGFVDSLARPGGTITGFTTISTVLAGKRLELLKETVPKLSRVAVLWDPKAPGSVRQWKENQLQAKDLGLQLHSMEVSSVAKFEGAFKDATRARSTALAVLQSPFTSTYQKQITDLATRHRLPAIYPRQDFVESGGLMSYGADRAEPYRPVASLVDKVLKGTKPADLPVEQPTKFELVINLKTAKALGLTIPPVVMMRAEKVFR